MAKDGRRFIILGSGNGAVVAAQTLREDGFQGEILIITDQTKMPYDRSGMSDVTETS